MMLVPNGLKDSSSTHGGSSAPSLLALTLCHWNSSDLRKTKEMGRDRMERMTRTQLLMGEAPGTRVA